MVEIDFTNNVNPEQAAHTSVPWKAKLGSLPVFRAHNLVKIN